MTHMSAWLWRTLEITSLPPSGRGTPDITTADLIGLGQGAAAQYQRHTARSIRSALSDRLLAVITDGLRPCS
jgi:hypothetical protein